MKTATTLSLVPAALFLALALPAVAEEEASASRSTEAVEILKKADEAARKVGTVRLEVSSKPSDVLADFVGPTEGEILMEGWDEEIQRPRKFWARVKTQRPGTGESAELTGGGNGETYFLIDHGTKKAYEDLDPAVLGSSGQALLSIAIAQFVHPTPFQRDIDAAEVELLGKEEVSGEECYQVRVSYGDGQETGSTWSISSEDFLPRRRVRHFNFGPQGEGALEVTLNKMELDPELEASLFKLKLPEGYEQVDDFAP